jgi:hypothetical protein
MHADLLSLQRVASSPDARLRAATSTTSLILLFSSNFRSCWGGLYVTLILADVPSFITISDGSTARLVLFRFWNPENAQKSKSTLMTTWGINQGISVTVVTQKALYRTLQECVITATYNRTLQQCVITAPYNRSLEQVIKTPYNRTLE